MSAAIVSTKTRMMWRRRRFKRTSVKGRDCPLLIMSPEIRARVLGVNWLLGSAIAPAI